jgi:hypothetical protein
MNTLKPKPTFQALIMSEESRLGREAIETAYALKQLITSGEVVWNKTKKRNQWGQKRQRADARTGGRRRPCDPCCSGIWIA